MSSRCDEILKKEGGVDHIHVENSKPLSFKENYSLELMTLFLDLVKLFTFYQQEILLRFLSLENA